MKARFDQTLIPWVHKTAAKQVPIRFRPGTGPVVVAVDWATAASINGQNAQPAQEDAALAETDAFPL